MFASDSNNNLARTIKLHVLGCGDAFGSGGRNQSSYLIEANDRLFLLDCGPTALLALKRAGFDPRDLDAILVSHLHGDHFGGLPFFLLDFLYRRPRRDPILIAGPSGTETKVRQLFKLMYGGPRDDKAFSAATFRVLHPDQPAQVAGIGVFPFRVPHQSRGISLALKVSCQNKQILFSGDSLWTDGFIDQSRGVDLFLCECSFFREQPSMHIDYQTLRTHLSRLQCRQLILTHLGEEMLAHQGELAVQVASDGMVIEI